MGSRIGGKIPADPELEETGDSIHTGNLCKGHLLVVGDDFGQQAPAKHAGAELHCR
jgi:hypothetical protein